MGPGPRLAPLFLAIAIGSPTASALEPDRALTQYDLQSWARAEGLPQSSAYAVVPARDGYLWLATQEGLVRFDGRRFVRFGPANERAFRSGFINALAEGRDGLWIGTLDGVVHQVGRTFRAFGSADGLAHPNVRSLVIDRSGRLWVVSPGGLQHLEAGRFTAPLVPQAGTPIVSITEAGDGAIWAATRDRLFRLDPAAPDAFGPAIPVPSSVQVVQSAPDGGVWVGGSFGLGRVRSQGSVFEPRILRDETHVSVIHVDASGSLWMGTQRHGLIRLLGSRVEELSTAQGLPSQSVVAIAEDAEGNLWLGLDRGGLARLSAGSFRTFGRLEGLAAESAFAIREGAPGEIWLTSDLGLSRIDSSGRVATFAAGPPSGPGAFASSLHLGPAGELLVGTFRDGLFVGRPGAFRRLADGTELPSIRAMLTDAAGTLWVGGSNGLSRVVDGRAESVPAVRDWVYALSPDGAGGLFAGTQQGLVALSASGVAQPLESENDSGRRRVVSLLRDHQGLLWVGTIGGGLGLFDGKRLRSLRAREGLSGDSVYGILEDDRGYLWCSNNEGVFRLSREEALDFFRGKRREVHSELFGRTDGLRVPECMDGVQPSAWRAQDGRLWFPTLGGAVVVDPRQLGDAPRPPRVVVEEVRVDGRLYAPDGPIDVPPGARRLEVAYAGLDLLAPERLRFRHRLAGFDPDFRDAGNRREAFYTNVPPGRYRFEVSARLGSGPWSVTSAGVDVTLRPHFYQTRTFLILALCGGALALLAAHQWRTLALRRRHHLLQQVVEERTRDLRTANVRLGELNHDLEEANRTLERLSKTDGLTGVANRRSFDERLDIEWRRAVRSGEPVALALLDVDHFKGYNDGYGHQAGDACLQRVAGALADAVRRPADLVARYGGEEFVVLLPGLGLDEAFAFVDTLRSRVEAEGIAHAFSSAGPRVTVSAGVASARPRDGGPSAVLVAATDAALYEAKRGGRNRVARG